MKKKNVTDFEFGKIVEEIPTCGFDCAMTHIYINNFCDNAINYLYDLARRLSPDKLQSYIIHLNGNTENLYLELENNFAMFEIKTFDN